MITTNDTATAGYYEASVTATFEGTDGASVVVTADPSDASDQIVVEARTGQSGMEFLGVEMTLDEVDNLIEALQAAKAYHQAEMVTLTGTL